VFKIENSTAPVEVSESLRPMLKSNDFNNLAADNQWLGWLGNRLWWSVPYMVGGAATDATSTFVLDPSVAGGTWTMFRSAADQALGPFAQGAYSQGSVDLFGFDRGSPNVVRVDALDAPSDNLSGTLVPFATRYTTRWMDAGFTDLKKRWKRPTFVALDAGTDYKFQVSVRGNFQKKVVRKFGVAVGSSAVASRYGDGSLYGDGTVYAADFDEEMSMRRGSSIGTMAATQLQLDGEPGISWGIGSIVFKYRARRMS
jgi:hypothetical protein